MFMLAASAVESRRFERGWGRGVAGPLALPDSPIRFAAASRWSRYVSVRETRQLVTRYPLGTRSGGGSDQGAGLQALAVGSRPRSHTMGLTSDGVTKRVLKILGP